MGLKCCVELCNLEANSSTVRLHRYFSKGYGVIVEKSSHMSKHFEEKHFIKNIFGNLILKSGDIPTIFDNVERSLFKVNVPNMKDDIDDVYIPISEYSSVLNSGIVVESKRR
ncbi:THAP domain-containing protein 6-like [Aphis craccivora]|uniref:THAP domain-containing protein 6-like n=1 Tax=Aphis craccivora TaxID=307492 RepID=A0A6G0ZI21_APHCR|nr:THAP domain-containing protein 6-like [Aphis craccivora]